MFNSDVDEIEECENEYPKPNSKKESLSKRKSNIPEKEKPPIVKVKPSSIISIKKISTNLKAYNPKAILRCDSSKIPKKIIDKNKFITSPSNHIEKHYDHNYNSTDRSEESNLNTHNQNIPIFQRINSKSTEKRKNSKPSYNNNSKSKYLCTYIYTNTSVNKTRNKNQRSKSKSYDFSNKILTTNAGNTCNISQVPKKMNNTNNNPSASVLNNKSVTGIKIKHITEHINPMNTYQNNLNLININYKKINNALHSKKALKKMEDPKLKRMRENINSNLGQISINHKMVGNITNKSRSTMSTNEIIKELNSNRIITSYNIANTLFKRKNRAKSFDGMNIFTRIYK